MPRLSPGLPVFLRAGKEGTMKFKESQTAPRLLSIHQAAHELGVCRTVVYELLRDGKIKSVKIGRRRLVPCGAVEAFIAILTNKEGD
jgi:excisionase family DNA binding protein